LPVLLMVMVYVIRSPTCAVPPGWLMHCFTASVEQSKTVTAFVAVASHPDCVVTVNDTG
jgi:hypothetical protein